MPKRDRELTYGDIVEVLQNRGWKAELVAQSDAKALVKTEANGLFKCVDGRASDHAAMRGPKALGGIYGIASNRGVTDLEGLKAIAAEVQKAGYLPSVHGDCHAKPGSMGCGYFKLWSLGQLDGMEPPKYDSDTGKDVVLSAGGVYETLEGSHTESEVMINFVTGTTFEPKGNDQRFVVDAWVTSEFDLDVPKYLVSAASTVEQLGGPKIAKLVVTDEEYAAHQAPKLTYVDIVNVLQGRGWKAELVAQSDAKALVETEANGLFKCVDGRASDHAAMRGPKALGGIYGIASNRGVTDLEGLKALAAEVRKAGYLPSVHGDCHAKPGSLGCGYFKLWSLGKFDGMAPPTYDSEAGKDAVLSAGGVYETLEGSHTESEVMINFVPGTTFEPKGNDQRFVVDAWVTSEFNLDVTKYLVSAASTVEQLGGPKIAKLVVTDKDYAAHQASNICYAG